MRLHRIPNSSRRGRMLCIIDPRPFLGSTGAETRPTSYHARTCAHHTCASLCIQHVIGCYMTERGRPCGLSTARLKLLTPGPRSADPAGLRWYDEGGHLYSVRRSPSLTTDCPMSVRVSVCALMAGGPTPRLASFEKGIGYARLRVWTCLATFWWRCRLHSPASCWACATWFHVHCDGGRWGRRRRRGQKWQNANRR